MLTQFLWRAIFFYAVIIVRLDYCDGQTLGTPQSVSVSTAQTVTATGDFVSLGLSLAVTTTSTTDKVILMTTLNWRPTVTADSVQLTFYRDGAAITFFPFEGIDAVRAGENFPVTFAYAEVPGVAGSVTYEVKAKGTGTVSHNGIPRTLLAFVVRNSYPSVGGLTFGTITASSISATSVGVDVSITLPATGPVLVSASTPYMATSTPISVNYGTYSIYRGTTNLAGGTTGFAYPACASSNKRRAVSQLFIDMAPSGLSTYKSTAQKGNSGTNSFTVGSNSDARSMLAFALPVSSAFLTTSTASTLISTSTWTAVGLTVTVPAALTPGRVLVTVQAYARSTTSFPTATGHYTIFRNGVNLGDASFGLQTVSFVSATPEAENRDATFFVHDTAPSSDADNVYTVMVKASVGSITASEPGVTSQLGATVVAAVASAAPTARPSTNSPTSTPTSAAYASFVTSPTYMVSPGFAFAARSSGDGSIWTWGQLTSTSSVTATATVMQPSGTTALVANRAAYAYLKTDGSVGAFGVSGLIAGSTTFTAGYTYKFGSFVSNEAAFAGISTTGGKVIAFGSYYNGGDVSADAKCNGYATQLSSGVVSIVASSAAFAALKSDGTVYAWGNKYAGGGVSSETRTDIVNVQKVFATASAFAALLMSGAVKTWGDVYGGGDSSAVASSLTSGVLHIIASQSVFVAYKSDTSLVVWGNPYYGGAVTSAVVPALTSGVKFVSFTALSFAALKEDGSVVAWGDVNKGGDTSAVSGAVSSNIAALYSNRFAFAALTTAGGVVAWGDADNGGLIPSTLTSVLSSGVTAIYSTHRAFAALKGATGQLVLWGSAFHGAGAGAAAPYLNSGVRTVCANDAAFTAILQDGRAVAWGHPSSIPTPGLLSGPSFSAVATCATGAVRAGA